MVSQSVLTLALAALLPTLTAAQSGRTTRYWDCCKPSCAWSGKAQVNRPTLTCSANDSPLTDPDVRSGCDGGSAFTCSNNSPWAVNDQTAYGFAATAISGQSESSWCCACYALTFTSGPVAGKTMVVQSTNTGGDLGSNHFDILMPGGGVGLFDGCTPQFGGIPGAQYGGVSSRSECDSMPANLKAGCQWRFDWFQNADNPDVSFKQVRCPSELTSISGCTRNDDGNFPAFSG
ncbi:glycoside hydrolase [Sarocladium strictum]